MKEVTIKMINEFKIKELGYDFMGYSLEKGDIWTFHHNIIAKRNGGPYERWNGAILAGKTSHPYLHLIEIYDYDTFAYLTSEMIDMNIKGFLDPINLMYIDEMLSEFEYKYAGKKSKKGKVLVKDSYLKRNHDFY